MKKSLVMLVIALGVSFGVIVGSPTSFAGQVATDSSDNNKHNK